MNINVYNIKYFKFIKIINNLRRQVCRGGVGDGWGMKGGGVNLPTRRGRRVGISEVTDLLWTKLNLTNFTQP